MHLPVPSAVLQKRLRWIILFPYLGRETTQLETYSPFAGDATQVRNLGWYQSINII